MIYEAILYQGMTIDLNTQRKHTCEHTRTTSDTDDHMHKSDSMSLHFQVPLLYADLSYIRIIVLINTKTPA